MRVFAREQPLRSQLANFQVRLEDAEQQNFEATQKQIQIQEVLVSSIIIFIFINLVYNPEYYINYPQSAVKLQALDAENREHAELMVKYQKTALELVETKQQVQVGNYMIENFDKIKAYVYRFLLIFVNVF